jgi:hypothetical protein
MPPFAQSLRQTQILILEILNVLLWLEFSPSLTLNKIGHFSKVSSFQRGYGPPGRTPVWTAMVPNMNG